MSRVPMHPYHAARRHGALWALLVWLWAAPGAAQTAPGQPTPAPATTAEAVSASVSGIVSSGDGQPLAGVLLELRGASLYRALSDGHGAFGFAGVTPGVYSLVGRKTGYVSASRDEVVLVSGTNSTLSLSLAAQSFSSLREITHISSSASQQQFNTSPAAVTIVTPEQFVHQGQTQVMNVLNQTPGIITVLQSFGDSNAASMSSPQEVQIRGALPYETASLIDGHPVAIGNAGYFSPNNINTYLLQDVEVVKGPGAAVPDINYAIGGSVNYRTLEPTVKPDFDFDIGRDGYGGISSNYRATGTTMQGKLQYALDYAITGSPGPLDNEHWLGSSVNFSGPVTVNGRTVCGNAPANAICPSTVTGGNPNYIGSFQFYVPVVFCCSSTTSIYNNRSELAKLRFNFSSQTSLTASFIGSQALRDGQLGFTCSCNTFAPPAGYVAGGSEPQPGLVLPHTDQLYAQSWVADQSGLFQTEFRTTAGKGTLLARLYAGADNSDSYNYPLGTDFTYTARAWGGLYLGNDTTPTIFHGQTVTVSEPGTAAYSLTLDHFRGTSLQWNLPSADNLYTISFDRNSHDSYGYDGYDFANAVYSGPTIPAGSGQTYQTIMARGVWQVDPHVQAMLANYFISYKSHYSPDGGVSFDDATHAFWGPRLASTWRPNRNTSVRGSLGSSIAPPYIALITVPAGPPIGNNSGAPSYYTQQVSSGSLAPETAFGWDLGVDQRVGNSGVILSADVYRTLLQNQFLSSTRPDGTYTPTEGINKGLTAPLYLTSVVNLGHSEYSGFEVSARRTPARGVGFIANLSLIRAFPYDLPPGFYDTAAGKNTTNLAILPNVNFQGSGNGYNGLADGRVPYAQGYFEANYTTAAGIRAALGATYYGSNNSYNTRSFGIVNANLTIPAGKSSSLVVSAWNLTNALSAPTFDVLNGTPEPLVNGQLGYASLNNVGPTTVSINYHLSLGR